MVSMTSTMSHEQLARRISEVALLRGNFKLRSGRTSTYYLDKYLFSTQPDILRELGRMFAKRLEKSTTLLAGAELGGIPLVTATSLASGLPCVFIRSARKEYGTSKQLEGHIDLGDEVVLVEDVATTGGQVLEAAEIINAAGANVTKIIATIDREEGARENIEKSGYAYDALFTATDLGISGE